MEIDQLIRSLVVSARRATQTELQEIVTHVAQRPFSSRLMKINQRLREELSACNVQPTSPQLPSVEVHLLKRIYVEQQWPHQTTVVQFEMDLHQAVLHRDVQIWTYLRLGEHHVGFLAPSHVQNVLKPEAFIFVAYCADYSTIKTGFQANSAEAVFNGAFERLVQHR